MQKNKLTILGLVTVVVLVAAIIAVKQESETVSNDQAGQYLFPQLKNKINDVAELEIMQRDRKFSVKNINGSWQVVEKNNYAAYLPKIKQTILRIAELTTLEAKTKRAENYGKIGVEEPTEARASSTQINLKDNDGKVLAALIVGKQQTATVSGSGVESLYVRKVGEEQSWLVKGELHVDPKEKDWLFTELFDVSAKRVQKVALSKDGKTDVIIEKSAMTDKDFSLLNIPKTKEIESSSEVNAIAEGLSNIVIKDVDAVGSDKAVAFDKDVYHAEYSTFDGLVVAVDTVKARGSHFAKFSAKFDSSLRKEPAPASAPAAETAKETDQEQKDQKTQADPHAPAQAPQLKDAALTAKEADDLNKKFEGWIFEISSTKADNMRKRMEDLLKVSG